MRQLAQGVDTVLHLAASVSPRTPWEDLLPNNIIGTYNVFQAAHEAQCRRVVFASSVNAVLGYPRDVVVKTSMPVSPPNLYGATKAWGEAAARSFVNKGSFSAICLRYGWVQARDSQSIKLDAHELDILITYEDLARLTVASIEAPDDLRFSVFHGVSNNRSSRMDISDAREVLGYQPQDDSFAIAERNAR
jgi:nucleoside-diphosphate-sugar epimerase